MSCEEVLHKSCTFTGIVSPARAYTRTYMLRKLARPPKTPSTWRSHHRGTTGTEGWQAVEAYQKAKSVCAPRPTASAHVEGEPVRGEEVTSAVVWQTM